MVPYEDLVAALASWRARNGLPPIHSAEYLGEHKQHRIDAGAPAARVMAAPAPPARSTVAQQVAPAPVAAPPVAKAAALAEFDDASDILDMEDSGAELDGLDAGMQETDDILHEETAAGDYATPSYDSTSAYGDSGRYRQEQAYGEAAPSYSAQQYGSGPSAPQAYGDSDPYSQQQYGSGPYAQPQYGSTPPSQPGFYANQPQHGSGPYAQPQYGSDPYAQPQHSQHNYGQQPTYGSANTPVVDSADQLYSDAGNNYIATDQQYQLTDQQYQLDDSLSDSSELESESEATMIGASLQQGSSYQTAPQSYRSSYPSMNDGVPSEPVYDSLGAAQEYAEDMESDSYGYDYGSVQPPPLEPPPDEDFVLPFGTQEKHRK